MNIETKGNQSQRKNDKTIGIWWQQGVELMLIVLLYKPGQGDPYQTHYYIGNDRHSGDKQYTVIEIEPFHRKWLKEKHK